MYLRGLANGDDEVWGASYGFENRDMLQPENNPSSMPSFSDWTGVISQAIETWGTYKGQQAQADMQRANPYGVAPYPYYSTIPRTPGQPGYSPFPQQPGVIGGFSTQTLLLLALAGAGIYFATR